MKWIQFLGASFSTFIILLFASSLFMDREFHVRVEDSIQADLTPVTEEILILRNWRHWMEQGEGAEQMILTFDGPDKGPGATLNWKGKSTNGILTVQSVTEAPGRAEMSFSVSMENGKGTSQGKFVIEEKSGVVTVLWEDNGSLGSFPLLRLLNPVMESTLSAGYKKNLENLKQRLEANRPTAE